MVLQNYQNFIELNSEMIYIVALGVGLKCPHKIYLNTQCSEYVCLGGGGEQLVIYSGANKSECFTFISTKIWSTQGIMFW